MRALTFEQWLEAYEEELTCKAAELGLDRDADFDSEAFADREYDAYLQNLRRSQKLEVA